LIDLFPTARRQFFIAILDKTFCSVLCRRLFNAAQLVAIGAITGRMPPVARQLLSRFLDQCVNPDDGAIGKSQIITTDDRSHSSAFYYRLLTSR